MELRVLQYFLAVAREESITRAAESLHITQPTLSRQLSQLEEELGTRLFERGTRHITLTPDGLLLRRRAEEISELVDKTRQELAFQDETLAGTVALGSGELEAVRVLPRLFQAMPESGRSADAQKHMGIGLSVCLSIVRAHGGEMSAANNEQGGASISFTLPEKENEYAGQTAGCGG